MNVTVKYTAQLRRAAGTGEERVVLPEAGTTRDLLILLARQHGEPLHGMLLNAQGEPQPTVLVFVGDEQVPRGQPPVLRDGDVVTLLTPIAGGSGSAVLTDEERAVYEWQLAVEGFGEAGQARLKTASVLVTRCGGVGGLVAYQLAAAGVGRLVLAHAGNVRPSDLNRQLLMTHDWLGKPRMESITRRLRELNPRLEIVGVAENVAESNAAGLVAQADVVVDCAPLFEERLLLNREAVRQGKPMIECAMYELEAQLTTLVPGQTPCLACLYPEKPPAWRRQFPVFGAVAGTIACLAALEALKLLAGFGAPLRGQLLCCDLRDMTFRKLRIERRQDCAVCCEHD